MKSLKKHLSQLSLSLFTSALFLMSNEVSANIVVTEPQLSVYPCSTYPTAYTNLGNIVLTEGANTDFTNSVTGATIFYDAPTNFEFQPGIGSVSFAGSGDITAASITITATQITVTFTTNGAPTAADALTISGIRVRGLAAVSGLSYITRSGGTAVIAGGGIGVTTYGILSSTAFPTAYAGPDQLICATTSTFAASPVFDPNITGTWSLVSGTGNIVSVNSATSAVGTVTPLTIGDNIFKWTITNGSCTSNSNVTITAQAAGLGCSVATNNFSAVSAISPAMGSQDVVCPPSSVNITQFTLVSPGSFNVGDKVLIIQMQGATVNTTDAAVNDGSKDAVFGAVTSYNGAGNYEYAIIATKVGNVITFSQNLKNTYNVAGKVQIVSIPQFANYTLSTTLNGTPWNSATGTGGVFVMEVIGTLTMNGGTINMDYRGFLGGGNAITPGAPLAPAALSFGVFNIAAVATGGYGVYSTGTQDPSTGYRGEGIAAAAAHLYGRGALANGGGSGGGWNSGAGGGSNVCAGGRGGYEYSSVYNNTGAVQPYYTAPTPVGGIPVYAAPNSNAAIVGLAARMNGVGGYALAPSASQVFMGGGGGASNGDGASATAGGNGGGIIIITAGAIAGTTGTLTARGQAGWDNGTAPYASTVDGTGGGGAGGSIILDVPTYSITTLNVNVNGGKGGDNNQDNTCHGNGGGGGAGLVRTKGITPNVVISAVAGGIGKQCPTKVNGNCFSGTYGALPGNSCAGSSSVVTQPIPQKACCSPANLGPDQTICGLGSILLSNGTLSNTNKTFKWYKNGILIAGATSATYTATSAGTYSVVVDSTVLGFTFCSVTNSMIITNSFPIPYLGPNQQLCSPSFLDLIPTNVGSFPTGTTWVWRYNGVVVSTETDSMYANVTAAGTYSLTATTAVAGCGPTTGSITLTTVQPIVVNDTRCGTGVVNLSVSGGNGGPYQWYDASTAGTLLTTGTSYSPTISTTTTYWVQDNGLYNTTLGPPLSMGTGGSIGTTASISPNNVYFDVSNYAINLNGMTAQFWAYSCGGNVTYTINVTNPGTGFSQTRTGIAGPCGPGAQTYTFTFASPIAIPIGTGYIINATGSSSTILSYSGPFSYPSSYGNILTIQKTVNGSSDNDAYPSFFDWQVSYVKPCARVPVVGTVNCPLPISLLDFTGEVIGNKTQLTWSTALEINNDYFILQRSSDGIHFESIGTINGNGTATSIHTYTFVDETPLVGLAYYKLIQVDLDGKTASSKVISVSHDNSGTVSIFPNPFTDETTLLVKSASQYKIVVRVYDLTGKVLFVSEASSSNEPIILGNKLSEGTYLVEVVSSHEKSVSRLIKVNK